jgi:hypothetical protein
MISLVAIVVSALAWSAAALAQANDPAVASCEMLVREELPNTTEYRYLSAQIAGSTATLRYETRDAGGPAAAQERRCTFVFDAPTGTWGFAPGLPDALLVAVSGALVHRGIYPIPREQTDLKSAR